MLRTKLYIKRPPHLKRRSFTSKKIFYKFLLSMQISIQQKNLYFGRLITGNTAKRKLCETNCPKHIINQFVSHRKTIRKSGINKLNKVDVILEYSDGLGYRAQISSHDKGVINFKNAIFREITNTQECIKKLKTWGEFWDSQFM